MRQILLLILVFFASQWLFRKLRRANARAQTASQGTRADTDSASGTGASGAPQLPDSLVRCAECGVHTPRSETLVVAGQRFCCSDHAHRHAARPTGRDAR